MTDLKITQWNVNSFPPNRNNIITGITNTNADIVCMQETRAKLTNPLKLTGYTLCARKDRLDTRGGGVSIHIKPTIPHTIINLTNRLEAVAIRAYLQNTHITICSLYLPPSLTVGEIQSDLTDLTNELPLPFIICTDSNSHHISWGSEESDGKGRAISELTINNNISILNTTEPTYIHKPNGKFTHIDLTLASSTVAPMFEWRVHPVPYHSDHFPLEITMKNGILPQSKPTSWIINKADWSKYNKELNFPPTFTTPDQACDEITTKFQYAASKSIPQTKNSQNRKPNHFWWNTQCMTALRKKKKTLNKYKNHRGNIQLWTEFKTAQEEYIQTTKEAQKASWNKFVSNLSVKTNLSEIWKNINKIRGHSPSPSIVLKYNNSIITTPKEVGKRIALDFSTRGSKTHCTHNNQDKNRAPKFSYNSEAWYNRDLTDSELLRAINSVTNKKTTPGNDNIPYIFLTKLNLKNRKALLNFYNYLWKHGLPTQWKSSVCIPIYKKGKPTTETTSYRPIALTSCLSKLMEKIIKYRLHLYFAKNATLDPYQSGFRMGHSTEDALFRLETSVRTGFLRDHFTVAIFLDISQAFDSVSHELLLQKVAGAGIEGNLGHYIQNFLENRKISVRYQNTMSDYVSVANGVPQGSVMSPSLFLLMINDIFEDTKHIQYSIFADDCAMWCTSKNLEECTQKMQAAMNQIHKWTTKWKLTLSTSKTKAILFTNRRPPIPLIKLGNEPIEFVNSYKFLGIVFDKHLTYKKHIETVVDHCQGDLRLLNMVSYQGWGADYTTLRRLYISLTRSKLNYASFIFATACATNLLSLDRIQYAAARTILGALRCTPVKTLEAEAHLLPLKICRREQLAQYIARCLTIPNHPCKILIDNYQQLQFYDMMNMPMPSVSRAKAELEFLKLEQQHIPQVQISDRMTIKEIPAYSSLSDSNKGSLPEYAWRQKHNELLSRYSDRTAVYTDGSLKDNSCGAAVWHKTFTILCPLPQTTNILTAEMYAIFSAIGFLKKRNENFLILSDSLSSIEALKNMNSKSHYLVHQIASQLSAFPNKFVIEWVPGHVGIVGNEKADESAAQARTQTKKLIIPLPSSTIKQSIHEKYMNTWQQEWMNSTVKYNELKPILQIHDALLMPRKEQIALSRIRLRTTRLSHKHLFSREDPPECHLCLELRDLTHVLLICPLYEEPRHNLRLHCRKQNKPFCMNTILSTAFPPEQLVKFLHEADVMREI